MYSDLSKTRLLAWRQCPKRLWLHVHRPQLAETSAQTQFAFQIGHNVGDAARSLYPNGLSIGEQDNPAQAVKLTRTSLTEHVRRPLFEPAFAHNGVLVRADVLAPYQKDGYRMVEVKSTTDVRPYQVEDAAIQAWVLRKSGLNL